jgi:hypothetical protein
MDSQFFYDEHLQLLNENKPNELVELHYLDDAEMMVITAGEPVVAKGQEQIKQLFTNYLTYAYRGFISTEKVVMTDDSIFLEATIDTVNGPAKVYDAMYLKDGKIYRHYSGMKG